LHNEELHDLYPSQSIIRIIKSRRMRWAGYVTRMGRKWESQKERNNWNNENIV
jgi:ribosomal protein S17E